MKVFCRFAPAGAEGVFPESHGAALRVRVGRASTSKQQHQHQHQQQVSVVDPVTESSAVFECDGAFVPSAAAAAGDRAALAAEQADVYRRAVLEGGLRAGPGATAAATGADDDDDNAVSHQLFLAYGQTASGKTYTLFGEAPTDAETAEVLRFSPPERYSLAHPQGLQHWRARLRSPTAGVIARFLVDLFSTHGGAKAAEGTDHTAHQQQQGRRHQPDYLGSSFDGTGSFTVAGSSGSESDGENDEDAYVPLAVDVSCFEIYNECATDLVALSVKRYGGGEEGEGGRQTRQARGAAPGSARGGAFHRTASVTSSAASFTRLASHESSFASVGGGVIPTPLVGAFVRWLGWQTPGGGGGGGTSAMPEFPFLQCEYRATEKAKVLRQLQRARCVSAEECWLVVQHLCALRQRCQTARNAGSSRGHLLLRFEVLRGGDGGSWPASETVFVDLAGSESYRDFSSAAAAAGDPRAPRRSGSQSTPSPADAAAAMLLHPGRVAQRAAAEDARRCAEMRGINTSLLALRKVIHALHVASVASPRGRRRTAGGAPVHAPFKDSTLTTVLQPLLGRMGCRGHAAVLLVCCSSRPADFHETVASLRLAAEAATVTPAIVLRAAPPPPPTRPAPPSRAASAPARPGGSARAAARRSGSAADTSVVSDGADALAPRSARGSAELPPRRTASSLQGDRGGAALAALEARVRALEKELADSRASAEGYRRTAEQLFAQCTTLCKSYDECVEELRLCHEKIKERDRLLAAAGLATPQVRTSTGAAAAQVLSEAAEATPAAADAANGAVPTAGPVRVQPMRDASEAPSWCDPLPPPPSRYMHPPPPPPPPGDSPSPSASPAAHSSTDINDGGQCGEGEAPSRWVPSQARSVSAATPAVTPGMDVELSSSSSGAGGDSSSTSPAPTAGAQARDTLQALGGEEEVARRLLAAASASPSRSPHNDTSSGIAAAPPTSAGNTTAAENLVQALLARQLFGGSNSGRELHQLRG